MIHSILKAVRDAVAIVIVVFAAGALVGTFLLGCRAVSGL